MTTHWGHLFKRCAMETVATPAKRAVGAARLSRGRSHTRGGHPKAGSCCDIRWGEREGGAHRRGLRAVCDRAEPGPPPEEEAKIFRCRYFPAWATHDSAMVPAAARPLPLVPCKSWSHEHAALWNGS